jgi:hypothetical protein
MAGASNVQTDFRGGIWSQPAQGRMDDPRYQTALNECLNGLPLEDGLWTRRPMFRSLGGTHLNLPAKLLPLSINSNPSHSIEVTDGYFRFYEGGRLITNGDGVVIAAAASGGVFTLDDEREDWVEGTTVIFQVENAGGNDLTDFQDLINKTWLVTTVAGNDITITDPKTNLDYSGAIDDLTAFTDLVLTARSIVVAENDYVDDDYLDARIVQTDKHAYIVHGSKKYPPWLIKHLHSEDGVEITVEEAEFQDGPYLDPPEGVTAEVDGKDGIVNVRFGHEPWDDEHAYNRGNVVGYDGQVYRSLTIANLNNQPDSSPSDWELIDALEWVNDGRGFLPGDIGRHIRLFSEPPLWDEETNYAEREVVTYNNSYYRCIQAVSADAYEDGKITGSSPTNNTETWVSESGATSWVWGIITDVDSDAGGLAGTPIGNFDDLANIFDSDEDSTYGTRDARKAYAGVTLSVSGPIDHVTLWPLFRATAIYKGVKIKRGYGFTTAGIANVTLKLRAKNGAAPTSATDGTKLGSKKIHWDDIKEKVRIPSDDVTTSWDHVWVEFQLDFAKKSQKKKKNSFNYGDDPTDFVETFAKTTAVAEIKFFEDNLNKNKIEIQVMWGKFKYVTSTYIRTLMLGKWNATEPNWPNCGTFHGGRLWMSSQDNTFDGFYAGKDNRFRPTEKDGTVTDANGISFTFNDLAKNKIEWMNHSRDGVVMGSSAGEWLVFAPDGGTITPTNIAADVISGFGSSPLEPVTADVTTVFAHKNTRVVYEFFRDKYFGTLVGVPMQEFSKGLTESGIIQLSYAQVGSTPCVWMVTGDGQLIGTTYKRTNHMAQNPPEYNGWHRHEHGFEGRQFKSVVGTKSIGGDGSTIMVTTYDKGSDTWRNEILDDLMILETDDVFMCNYLDGGYIPPNAAVYGEIEEEVTIPAVPAHWEMPGWTLSAQCTTTAALNVPSDLVGLTSYTDPVTAVATYITGPTASPKICGAGDFVTTGEVPGVEVLIPTGSENTVAIRQYIRNQFGADSYRTFQRWTRDSGTLGAAPAATYVAEVPESTVTTMTGQPEGVRLYGLAEFNNKTISVFICGLDLGDDFVVQEGYLDIPFGELFTYRLVQQVAALGRDWGRLSVNVLGKYTIPCVVGFKYRSRGQRLRPASQAESGAQNGPAFGKMSRQYEYALRLTNSKGVEVGTDFDHLFPIPEMIDPAERPILVVEGDEYASETELISGIITDTLADTPQPGGMFCWEASGCWPCNISAAGSYLKTEDKP